MRLSSEPGSSREVVVETGPIVIESGPVDYAEEEDDEEEEYDEEEHVSAAQLMGNTCKCNN